jgi:hypothetical protein
MNTPTYTIHSKVTYPEEDLDFSEDAKIHYKVNALSIERTLNLRNVGVKMKEIVRQKYFVQYYCDIKVVSNIQDLVKNKENLKLALGTTYLQIRYPVRGHLIRIETPNYFTNDIKLKLNIDDFKLIDFQFLKALNVCINNDCIDLILLKDEIDDIDEYMLLDIINYIDNEKILNDVRSKGRDMDYGVYWYRWREKHRR